MSEPITKEGFQKLKEELKHLVSVVRPQILKDIEVAREHGDLSENAEYHAAREKQSFTIGKIEELNALIAEADVLDPDKLPKDRVVFGRKVRLLDEENQKEVTYQIVGKTESNLKEGKISYNSPIAKALVGKRVDDIAEVKAPKGVVEYTIVEIL